MRIATWNINGLRARLDFVLHWLDSRQPDVVGLQELKLEDKDFPNEAFGEAGYTCLTHGQKSWNGVATLTRDSAEVVQKGLPGQEEFGSRMLEVSVSGLNYATLYCPNGKNIEHEDYPRKLAWFDSLIAYVQENHDPESALLLGGDFNICPEPLDSWSEDKLLGGIFHTDAERERMRALANWGLVDLYRKLYPEDQTFSWWDYRGGAFHRGMGLRIDLLLGTPAVADRVIDTVIDRDYRKKKDGMTASDHAPVWVDLEA
ncbi:MAG: exodeoxyribonuclease III [Acidobacteriota bacterium]